MVETLCLSDKKNQVNGITASYGDIITNNDADMVQYEPKFISNNIPNRSKLQIVFSL